MKKPTIQLIVLSLGFFLLFAAHTSFSQTRRQKRSEPVKQIRPDWTFVCNDVEKTTAYYIKTNSIGRTQQKTFLVWEKQVFLQIEDKGEYHHLLFEHDCTERKSRSLEFTSFNKNDELLTHYGREKMEELDELKWTYVGPGTVRESVLNAACKAAAKGHQR